MLVFVVAEERAAVAEQFHDDGIRSENILAFVFGQAFEVYALIVQWRVDFQAIFLAGIKVVGAMTGGGMNDAATLIERDVIGENARHLNRQEGMLKFHALEIAALNRGAHASFLDAAFRLQSGDAIGGQQQGAFSVSTTT